MTRRLTTRVFILPIVLMLMTGMGWSTASWALDLQSAKAQGLVGEQPNGYLGSVKGGASAEVNALIKEVNSARKQEYQSIAKRNNTELSVVEALAGKKAIEMTPSGQYVKSTSGQWIKK